MSTNFETSTEVCPRAAEFTRGWLMAIKSKPPQGRAVLEVAGLRHPQVDDVEFNDLRRVRVPASMITAAFASLVNPDRRKFGAAISYDSWQEMPDLTEAASVLHVVMEPNPDLMIVVPDTPSDEHSEHSVDEIKASLASKYDGICSIPSPIEGYTIITKA